MEKLAPEITEAERRMARRWAIETLHQISRRLRAAETREEWMATLRDAAAADCGACGIFLVEDGVLKGEGVRSTPVTAAPAFQSAVETQDTIVTMRSSKELSEAVTGTFPAAPHLKAYLFPILREGHAVAVLYAQQGEDPVNMSALELLTALAGPCFPRHESTRPEQPDGNLVSITPLKKEGAKFAPAVELTGTDWAMLTRDEQDLHIRAQRFARVRVAEIRLYQADGVKAGRESRNLYDALQSQIEMGREDFQKQFLEVSPTMVDYFHQELVRTLANHDAEMLGSEYPGPLR
jgi:hypothetical protein